MGDKPHAGAGYTDLREKVMQDSLDGLIAAGLARGDDDINETPDEWHRAARLARQALRMHLLLKEAVGLWTVSHDLEPPDPRALTHWLFQWLPKVEAVLESAAPRPADPMSMLSAFVSAALVLDAVLPPVDHQKELVEFRILLEQARRMVIGDDDPPRAV